jgi:protein SCO1/2
MKRAIAALAAVACLAGGCDRLGGAASPFKGIDITGTDIRSDLHLADPEGRVRTLAEFRGKLVVVLFGYTQCPDVCPTSLADLGKTVRQLGEAGKRVQVIFITVDPGRDTPALLKQYIAAFSPDFIALRGDADAVQRVTKDFKVYAAVHESPKPAEYTVEHAGQMFVFDGQGRARLMFPPAMAPADMAADLKVLLNNE